eukprot:TRINITY_DN839_c1_g1_i10.p1 TRINITY_DN839_c1_g1~~TRINITY_DN839_c1_g1_i10.p1  ORF type:complete len:271 (+),score=69.61 TRINITY_DN839_c1_g1_i10:56-868(+)
MKCMIVVLAVASLCLAEPEADPLHYYAPYAYPYAYRPYFASGYAGPLPGHSYQSVHRLHKREADANPQLLLNAGLHFPTASIVAPVAAPLAAPVPAPLALPVQAPLVLPVAHAVAHAPIVKSVVETPAVVSHQVHSVPLVHHVAPHVHHAAPLVHHAAPVVHHAAPVVKHEVTPFVNLGRKRREAEADADADAEADADAYYYSSVAGHGQAYSTFVDDHPVVAYSHPLGYNYGLPYGYNYGLPYGYNYGLTIMPMLLLQLLKLPQLLRLP